MSTSAASQDNTSPRVAMSPPRPAVSATLRPIPLALGRSIGQARSRSACGDVKPDAAERNATPGVDCSEKRALQPVLFKPAVRVVSETFTGRVRALDVDPKSVLWDMMRRLSNISAGLPESRALLGWSSIAATTLQAALSLNKQSLGARRRLRW